MQRKSKKLEYETEIKFKEKRLPVDNGLLHGDFVGIIRVM
jgi:hypothetical protein